MPDPFAAIAHIHIWFMIHVFGGGTFEICRCGARREEKRSVED